MHPSDQFAMEIFQAVLDGDWTLDDAWRRVSEGSVGAACRFYDLVDEYTTPS
jgi:hypothetical protein